MRGIRDLKAESDGEDEYRIDLHTIVLCHGNPDFVAPRTRLRVNARVRIGEGVIRLTYDPA